MTTLDILKAAKAAAPSLAALSTEEKNRALLAMADALEADTEALLAANRMDLEAAEGRISTVMLDRLRLTEDRIRAMAHGIREVVELPDPIGRVIQSIERPNGLRIERVRVPMGVTAIIYESRPNVTSDAAALSLKSGNVCVLRGERRPTKAPPRSSARFAEALPVAVCPRLGSICWRTSPVRVPAS